MNEVFLDRPWLQKHTVELGKHIGTTFYGIVMLPCQDIGKKSRCGACIPSVSAVWHPMPEGRVVSQPGKHDKILFFFLKKEILSAII